jgi:Leucine-rich repeat (LRR) protein
MSPTIFRHKKVVTVDIYYNLDISGHLPDFSNGSRLENLNVGRTNFSSIIPASLGNLTSMTKLGLVASRFSEELPPSMTMHITPVF